MGLISSPTGLLIGLLLLIGAAGAGFWHGIEFEDGQHARREVDRQNREALALAEFWKGQRAKVAAIGRRLADARADRDDYVRELRETRRNSHVALTVCPPDGGPARLTPDGVRAWNRGLALGVSGPDRAAWLDGANPPTDPPAGR